MPFDFYTTQNPDTGNGPSAPKRTKRTLDLKFSPKWIVICVIVIFALIVLGTSLYIVDQTEQSVILRCGRYIETVGPGLHIKLPFGIDQNYNVPTQTVQTLTYGYRNATSGNTNGRATVYNYSNYSSESTMLTGDLNIVDIQWIVQYKIENPYLWLFSVENNKQTINDISRSVVNQLVGDLPILSIMSSERTTIEEEAQSMIQDILNEYRMGAKIITVKLQDIVPPAGDVQDAFEDVNKAIQDMNKYINQGKENYNSIIPAAQGEANRLEKQAEGYASERVNTAKGDVARFESVLKEYEKSKEVTSKRLYIETMEDILSDQTVIDRNLENYLPVSNLTKGGNK